MLSCGSLVSVVNENGTIALVGVFKLIIIVFVEDVERIETRLVLRHADKHIFLLLLRLLRGVEEGVEDALEGLNFVNWTRLRLHLIFRVYLHISLQMLTER